MLGPSPSPVHYEGTLDKQQQKNNQRGLYRYIGLHTVDRIAYAILTVS
jgi:hypothetical protein